jgi:hypothetical protein
MNIPNPNKFDKEWFLSMVDKITASTNEKPAMLYDYIPESERQNICIEDGKEIWLGLEVIRTSTKQNIQ